MSEKVNIIVKEGFLTKSPPQEKIMANWHKRFFVLWSSGYMEYYSSSEKKPQDYLKTIDLNSCEDMVAPFPVGGRTYVIKIAIAGKGGKNRDYLFDCDNQDLMDEWVTQLAGVCGFTAVDCEVEADNYSSISSSPQDPTSPPPLPPVPRPQMTTPPPVINRPQLRPPLPLPKRASTPPPNFGGDQAVYEDPNLVEFSSQYSSVSGEFGGQIEEDVYDGNISEFILKTLNHRPPPVWKNPANDVPPPLPPTRTQKRFRKSLERQQSDTPHGKQFHFAMSPPPLPGRPPREDPNTSTKPLPKPPGKSKWPNSPVFPKKKALPPPPPKKRATTPPAKSISVDFRADLGSKLKKRQEMTRSWSEDDQLQYEEIRDNRMTPSPSPSPRERAYSSASDTGSYVDCDPSEPQAYLDYHHSKDFLGDFVPSRTDNFPLPLPPRDSSWSPPPPLPTRTQPEEEEEEAPPVPRRHPQASGRMVQPLPPVPKDPHRVPSGKNVLPIPSRLPVHDPDDEAPPVPSRGVESTRPPLNRPMSETKSSRGPPLPSRGISAPAHTARLHTPPGTPECDNIFEEVSFGQTNKVRHKSPQPPVSARGPRPKLPPPTSRRPDTAEDTFNRSQLDRPPISIPKNARADLSPRPSPPLVSSKPKPPPAINKKPSPPPVSNKPTAPPPATKPKLPKSNGESDFRRMRDNVSPSSPEVRKKLPIPPFLNGENKPRDWRDGEGIKTSSPGSRRKFPEPSFLSELESRKKQPEPPHINHERHKNAPFLNGGVRSSSEERPTPPTKNPGMRRKLPEPYAEGRKKLPIPPAFNIAQETTKKPPPPTPKSKPVIQNSNKPHSTQGGYPGVSHKPTVPLKPKPMLPPRL